MELRQNFVFDNFLELLDLLDSQLLDVFSMNHGREREKVADKEDEAELGEHTVD